MISQKQKKFGVVADNSLGIYHRDLNALLKLIPRESKLAIELFDSNIYEARLLCSKIFPPKNLTESLMEKWVSTFNNWEICDSFSMVLFARSKFALAKAVEWSERPKEFEKRAGFAIMAAYCNAEKKADNVVFIRFFPLILREAHDDRLYVKKAISWALRSIGKRNIDLKEMAIDCANKMFLLESRSAKWIAKDVLRELERDDVRISDYPRSVYRN